MAYDVFEHKHRFAVWAAARAAQRGFGVTTVDVGGAVEHCGIVEFLRDPSSIHVGRDRFNTLHKGWCRCIIRSLTEKGVRDATFGRAAKIVAVYLKSMVVVGSDPGCSLASAAHPPLDRVMLQNLSSDSEIQSPYKHTWKNAAWTKLGEKEYYELVGQLFACLDADKPLWHLEKYWIVSRG